MTLVIKTTVIILDIGTSKHQCMTMQTKDLRVFIFKKAFCALRQL